MKIPAEQLDALVAPIALYPDNLLSQVLVASTYPLEVGLETGWHEVGSLRLASSPERMEELKRRMASSLSWGVEDTRLLTPAEVKAMIPHITESRLTLVQAFNTTGDVLDAIELRHTSRAPFSGHQLPESVQIGLEQQAGFEFADLAE